MRALRLAVENPHHVRTPLPVVVGGRTCATAHRDALLFNVLATAVSLSHLPRHGLLDIERHTVIAIVVGKDYVADALPERGRVAWTEEPS
jgi:hypothetical protein